MRPGTVLKKSGTVTVMVSLRPADRRAARAAVTPALVPETLALIPRRLSGVEKKGVVALPLARPLTVARVDSLKRCFLDAQDAPLRARRSGERGDGPRYYPNLGILVGTTDGRGLASLEGDPGVAAVDLLPVLEPIRPVGPPRRSRVAGAKVGWGIRRLRIERLWAQGFTGAGVCIGHLDTGIDGDHPAFLPDAIAAFTVFDAFGREVPGPHVAFDTAAHGTHTAGTMVARGVDGRHVGVAPGAVVASAVVIEGGQVVNRVLAGIDWCLGHGARIINMSLGVPGRSPALQRLLETLRSREVLPVVAVGNDGPGTSRTPGNEVAALSVGALDRGDGVPGFSSSQAFARADDPFVPDLVAPGVQIQSVAAGGGWSIDAGTSMAAPHVSGLAALLWEARPSATVAEIEAAIRASCAAVADEPSRGGDGVPDGPRALEALTGITAAARRHERVGPRKRSRSRRR